MTTGVPIGTHLASRRHQTGLPWEPLLETKTWDASSPVRLGIGLRLASVAGSSNRIATVHPHRRPSQLGSPPNHRRLGSGWRNAPEARSLRSSATSTLRGGTLMNSPAPSRQPVARGARSRMAESNSRGIVSRWLSRLSRGSATRSVAVERSPLDGWPPKGTQGGWPGQPPDARVSRDSRKSCEARSAGKRALCR